MPVPGPIPSDPVSRPSANDSTSRRATVQVLVWGTTIATSDAGSNGIAPRSPSSPFPVGENLESSPPLGSRQHAGGGRGGVVSDPSGTPVLVGSRSSRELPGRHRRAVLTETASVWSATSGRALRHLRRRQRPRDPRRGRPRATTAILACDRRTHCRGSPETWSASSAALGGIFVVAGEAGDRARDRRLDGSSLLRSAAIRTPLQREVGASSGSSPAK